MALTHTTTDAPKTTEIVIFAEHLPADVGMSASVRSFRMHVQRVAVVPQPKRKEIVIKWLTIKYLGRARDLEDLTHLNDKAHPKFKDLYCFCIVASHNVLIDKRVLENRQHYESFLKKK
ncbi:hypothetical protein HYPSUDRAFT_210011 [Hypholoma sublateritium FD-334 SS-4]|uniref:Uncharacterized protein n=1 Tax=Hypholoma sublateritium (strain FD-334 SS-4) TaxID=945553 RepID=A0A0D2KED9_HYPSF|nr:hypothetical protein HYPSUDRAFT_210011 [Hypholoma sublateritium FD-334 SS-4]